MKNQRFDITACPDPAAIQHASEVLRQYQLHFYQLRYFNDLTAPDGGPFKVEGEGTRVRITHRRRPEFYMTVGLHDLRTNPVPEIDGRILAGCVLIQKAVGEGKEKFNTAACCPLAEPRNCVCDVSMICPLHGTKCVGTHD